MLFIVIALFVVIACKRKCIDVYLPKSQKIGYFTKINQEKWGVAGDISISLAQISF